MSSTRRDLTTIVASAIALAVLATPALAQAKHSGAAKAKQAGAVHAAAKSLEWGPAPAVFPKGARMAVESGDPTKSGEFVIRLSMPANYRIPPHWHPTAEHVQIRRGTFLVGMGDTLSAAKANSMSPGDTGTIPARMHHFAMTKTATVLSITSQGPFAMTYVNPADDPSRKK